MLQEKSVFITTPIYYVNAEPHIGHTYTTIIADTMKRFYKMLGADVFLLTGTDEHGEKIQEKAAENNMQPLEFADMISARFRTTWDEIGIEYDDFIRTTEQRHTKVVREVLRKVHEKGDIYFDEYEGNYCVGCERFLRDNELVNGKCPDHDRVPKIVKESNYFFRMSKYQKELGKHIAKHTDFIRPEQYRKEVLSFLNEPLEDLCISRPKNRLTWGVELPFDTNYVTYVWFDALLNYVSALGYPDSMNFERLWPGSRHIIGKDILKTHAIYWPTMLMSAGIPLYQHLDVHGFWLRGETKMSKSLGNVVSPLDFKNKFGIEPLRYFYLREMSFGS
ncbi:MAG TPA: class I tRNA ligase family protein, partial [Patescibacteria group bacterium]|nr:class I tRNA ligase family protein [Patescibacteria group bacterium]